MDVLKLAKEKSEIKELLEEYNQKDVRIPTIRRYYNQSLFGNQIDLGEFNSVVDEFLCTALFEMPCVNWNTLIYNIQQLTIQKCPSSHFENMKLEQYYPYINHIEVCEDSNAIIDVIHALLHMASRYLDEKELRLGFSFIAKQDGISQEWGRGINEGYTARLEERYFPQYVTMKRYAIQQRVMSTVEYVIGGEKLEQYFFDADVECLIEDLQNYLSKERIITLIRNLDFITENNNKKNHFLKQELALKIKEINAIMRELAFGYFDFKNQIDSKLVSIMEENQLQYYVYQNEKYPIEKKSYQYHL